MKINVLKKLLALGVFTMTVGAYLSVNYSTAINLANAKPHNDPIKAANKDALAEAANNDRDEEDNPAPEAFDNLYNPTALNPFFEKLMSLDTFHDRKINIVHIGDSHIQADVMTNLVRNKLQENFGNAGLGLVFPYSLLKTNGGRNVSFSSNIIWNGEKTSPQTGITGYALSTNKKNFVIELNLKNKEYAFNTVKIITPDNQRLFELATNVGKVTPLKHSTAKSITHKVSKGETLYSISRKYHSTVEQLKKLNHLQSGGIRVGQVLKVGTKTAENNVATKVDMSNATILDGNTLYNYYMYDNLDSSEKIYLTPNNESDAFTLDGIVLENKNNGIIYHTIGVNGAHFSDYNKSARFFEQIKALEPDLLIISLGTNETFGRMTAERYNTQVAKFIAEVRAHYGNCPILFTTPPPSLYKRKNPNPLCGEYADALIGKSVRGNYSVFDLYRALGGSEAMDHFIDDHLIASDRVHYTHTGYLAQGDLFYNAFISNYLLYKKQSKLPLKPYLN